MSENTWSHRVARRLVKPLVGTCVTPNHLTAMRLATGLGAAALYAAGSGYTVAASALWIISLLMDRADGELARAADMRSEWGDKFDVFCDTVSNAALFVGIGFGLQQGSLGQSAVVLGLSAGLAILAIHWTRKRIERVRGPVSTPPNSNRLLDGDDFLYLVAPITWLDGLQPFVVAAGIGAPIFYASMEVRYRAMRRRRRSEHLG